MADPTFTPDVTLYDENGNVVAIIQRPNGDYALAVDAKITGFTVIADVRTLEQKLADEGKLFAASTNVVSLGGGSGAETPLLYIKNGDTTGILARLFEVVARLHTNSNFSVVLRIYLNPTVTDDGTLLFGHNENSMSANTPDVEVFLSPTVTGNGTFHQAYELSSSVSLELNYNLSKIIDEGDSLLITYEKNSAANVDLLSTIHWGEEDLPA